MGSLFEFNCPNDGARIVFRSEAVVIEDYSCPEGTVPGRRFTSS